jgi:hypothetical protein
VSTGLPIAPMSFLACTMSVLTIPTFAKSEIYYLAGSAFLETKYGSSPQRDLPCGRSSAGEHTLRFTSIRWQGRSLNSRRASATFFEPSAHVLGWTLPRQ